MTVAEPPAAESKSDEKPDKPKYKKPPTIGDRQKLKGKNPELEMIGRLGIQARDILGFALKVESDNNFQNFQDYLAFREKISEFEAFCNVIESHLKEVVTERKQELEDRFYSLWSMIFAPTVRALIRFFDQIHEEQVLPLGGKDMLDAELRALEGMRSVLSAPRFAKMADKEMLGQITKLESTLSKLSDRATSLPDFSNRTVISRSGAIIPGRTPAKDQPDDAAASRTLAPHMPAAHGPGHAAGHGAAPSSAPSIGEAPNLRAVRELKALLDYYRRDRALKQYVDIDTRAVDEIERKLVANPMDPAAIVWMRQIVNAWSSRLRGDEKDKDMRRVLAMIKST
jgi:hypothetical protein